MQIEGQNEIPLGVAEGLALIVDDRETPDSVHESHKYNDLIGAMIDDMGDEYHYLDSFQNGDYTSIFFYVENYDRALAKLKPHIDASPLCKTHTVERIA